jgi:hypothetical protein
MSQTIRPSVDLLLARRALEEIQQVELIDDWRWDEAWNKWYLVCRLNRNGEPENLVPLTTEWYVLVDPAYPWGRIKFYPSTSNGLTATFNHQDHNGLGKDECRWRSGSLCLDTSVGVLGRLGYDTEPYDPGLRLAWHFQRALKWLDLAARGELVEAGDPFELPHFPSSSDSTVCYYQDAVRFREWNAITERWGIVDFGTLRQNPTVLVPLAYKKTNNERPVTVPWGSYLGALDQSKKTQGMWLLLPEVPVVSAWQVPRSWGELRRLCLRYDINLVDAIGEVARHFRDGRAHPLVLGFPIPETVGEPPKQYHWQALWLPVLSWGKQVLGGWRQNERAYWLRDRTQVLKDADEVQWIESQNWSPEQVHSRGAWPEDVRNTPTLVLGVGALGSAVAELLVRAGFHDLTVMDGDLLHCGNLGRHSLTMKDLERHKAISVAHRLNSIHPHASVKAVYRHLDTTTLAQNPKIDDCQLVIDSTGQDGVLHVLSHQPWRRPKRIVSVSFGLQCRRLYCLACSDTDFPLSRFMEGLQPWLALDVDQMDGPLPREGVGCWHPVFPGRADDIWMLAAVAVRFIVEAAQSNISRFVVYEQNWNGNRFVGLSQVHDEVLHNV